MKASNPHEALRLNKQAFLDVLAAYGVTDPRIFGSDARGDFRPNSDLDILVSRTRPMSYSVIARLRREASEALGWPVDLVFDTALKDEVRVDIARDIRSLP
ncbi:hypothetical protein FP2506_01180 [Fulvimarina pelagi HTCC2506]|uniref:Polymerase nucleotidyl transferase domain-containing protein n=1 Tax=Fulvimarina pelagi HTCC2506 TaxID=314231 RepID=Q0G261_9HYPH|nr:nucleotidyltransferase domain-containing protein [Fulvimarina pelagi]EAU41337.1 hypothetical protein FP2506_01180 [Fulvimarina pelagi HTCC2506]